MKPDGLDGEGTDGRFIFIRLSVTLRRIPSAMGRVCSETTELHGSPVRPDIVSSACKCCQVRKGVSPISMFRSVTVVMSIRSKFSIVIELPLKRQAHDQLPRPKLSGRVVCQTRKEIKMPWVGCVVICAP